MPPLTPAETKALSYSVMTDAQKHRFEEDLELDFSFGMKGLARFRANIDKINTDRHDHIIKFILCWPTPDASEFWSVRGGTFCVVTEHLRSTAPTYSVVRLRVGEHVERHPGLSARARYS